MRVRSMLPVGCLALFIGGSYLLLAARGQPDEDAASPSQTEAGAQQDAVEHGQYIVHHVAMCIYCHTPRGADGEPDMRRLLRGAPMPVGSPFPQQTWAFQAPKIAGLPGGWKADDLVRFLQTGETPTGHQPRPPMPPFRMNEEDARGVAAYLQSL